VALAHRTKVRRESGRAAMTLSLARSSSPTPGAVEAGLTAGVAKPDYNRSRNVG
jgi:hypothetical protein